MESHSVPRFRSLDDLRKWMSASRAGELFFLREMEARCQSCEALRDVQTALATSEKRQPVLVVAHADGFLEVFGTKSTDCRVVNMPATECETLAEEWLESQIPKMYRDIYQPALRRAIGNVLTITAEQLIERRRTLDVLKELRKVTQ